MGLLIIYNISVIYAIYNDSIKFLQEIKFI